MLERSINDEWIIIVNPVCGNGFAKTNWSVISQLLRDQGFRFQHIFTEKDQRTIEKTKSLIELGYHQLIVVGGDGTINEVANGIMLQQRIPSHEVQLGVIPVGTGNDWIRTMGIPNDFHSAIQLIKSKKTVLMDVAWATYQANSEEKKRFFVNTAGTGLDSIVVDKTNQQKMKTKSSAVAYMINLLKAFIGYRAMNVRIQADNGVKMSGKLLDFVVGNCRYNGGGMIPFPKANPTDGLLDCLFVSNMTKFKMILSFPKLFNGTIDKISQARYFRSTKIALKSDESIFLEVDGETLGYDPFTFGICPKALSVFSNVSFSGI